MRQLKQCLGVDLGYHTVKVVELALDRNSVRTLRAASAPTGANPAMSADEANQAIVAALKEVIKKGRFSSRKAIFAISGQKVFVRRFRLPRTSEERLHRIIQYEARQQIPFPLDKTILQYEHHDLPEEGEVEVLLVAIRSDEVRNFMNVANKTGLKPLAVGVSSFALFNAYEFMSMNEANAARIFESLSKKKKTKKPRKGKKGEEPAQAPEETEDAEDQFAYEEVRGLINIGATSYDLAIGRSGKNGSSIGFIRTVPMGGNDMTRAVSRICRVDSFLDAERIKASSTQLMTFALDFEEESQVNQEASQAVTDVADKIISEVRRSLDFYITQPDGMAIDSLVLSGGQALLPGLDSYLEEKLTVPVTVIKEPPEGSPFKWQESAGPITPYLNAIGLALQGMGIAPITVDFLPEEQKITRDFPYRVAAVMLFLVGGTVAFSSQAGKEYASKYELASQSLQGELLRKKQQVAQFTDAQQVHDDVAEKFLQLDKSFGQRQYYMDVIVDIAEAKPAGVMILDIDGDHQGNITVVGESTVQVDAPLFNEAIKEVFGDRLKGESTIESVNTSPAPAGGGEQTHQFTIKFRLKDKINHLKITPTPTATPTPGPGGGFFGGPGFGGPGARF